MNRNSPLNASKFPNGCNTSCFPRSSRNRPFCIIPSATAIFLPVPSAALTAPGEARFASDYSKLGPYADELEPLSPFSILRHYFQPPNTPIASPTFDDRQPRPRTSFHEALSAGISKTPMNQNANLFGSLITPPQSAQITPPQSAQISSSNWMSALGDQSISASPAISSSGDKAEGWSTVASESTCGATPSASLTGIGSDGMRMSDNLASVSGLMMPSDPSPTSPCPW